MNNINVIEVSYLAQKQVAVGETTVFLVYEPFLMRVMRILTLPLLIYLCLIIKMSVFSGLICNG